MVSTYYKFKLHCLTTGLVLVTADYQNKGVTMLLGPELEILMLSLYIFLFIFMCKVIDNTVK